MAMAVDVSQRPAQGLANGTSPSPSPEAREKLYDQLIQLRDVVLAGKHAQFKLPPSAVAQLKASLIVPSTPLANGHNGAAVSGQAPATNNQQQMQSSSSATTSIGKLPGLQNHATPSLVNGGLLPSSAKSNTYAVELDPIFLQKSDRLVREESRLKRQRLERQLQAQLAENKQHGSRDRDNGTDVPPPFDITLLLRTAMEHVKHVSGLKAAGSAASSSFDENDYYSSLVQSDWSSDASSTKGSDRATGAFTDDFERLDGSASKGKRPVVPGPSVPYASRDGPRGYANDMDNLYDMDGDDDDDEYVPPDAAAFDASRVHKGEANMQQATPDDDSDYEPGEITAVESINPSPRYQPQQQMQPPPPNVPVIRNHLTHIVAPQPNRVSPLTTTKDSNIELELVNGRPEIVHKHSYPAHQASRLSSASPTGHSGPGPSKHKKKQKKRKRDNEPQGRNKRRQKQVEMEAPRSPVAQEPYIKPEPMSPPPFVGNLPPAPGYAYAPYQPAPVDLTGSRAAMSMQYAYEPQSSYQHGLPEPPQVIRVASPAQRPARRDNQDLRRVASLHHAQRPHSPQANHSRAYSPVAPYRATSMAYGDQRLQAPAQDPRPRSRILSKRYDDAYSSRAASPALMPPPPPPPPAQPVRRIVQDQYGNKYYASDPAPAQPSTIRASAVPESYERAPSRTAYAQPPAYSQQYEPPEDRMPPPPPRHQPADGVEEPFEYTDADGYIVRGYRIRPAERPQQQHQPRYSEAPTSPAYQEYRPHDQMPPPQLPRQNQEPTSPTYNPNLSRSYSVRPEQPPPPAPPNYLRQASVAPVQYVPLRQGSVAPQQYAPQQQQPPRATSMMPGDGYVQAPQWEPQTYSQNEPPRFIDQYGNPVYPSHVAW